MYRHLPVNTIILFHFTAYNYILGPVSALKDVERKGCWLIYISYQNPFIIFNQNIRFFNQNYDSLSVFLTTIKKNIEIIILTETIGSQRTHAAILKAIPVIIVSEQKDQPTYSKRSDIRGLICEKFNFRMLGVSATEIAILKEIEFDLRSP